MSNPFIRRVLVALAILVLVAVSTAAVAHSHVDTNSADESHCPLCMAVHATKHAIATPIIRLSFTAAQIAILVPLENSAIVFVQPLLTQDRAPPQV